MNLGPDFAANQGVADRVKQEGSLAERWVLSRYAAMLSAVTEALGRYEMAEAARALHEFFWSEFCDWFVEMSKPALRAGGAEADRARRTLCFVLDGTLRALHPFMPFITEEIWRKLPVGQVTNLPDSIMLASWPEGEASWRDEEAEREMEALVQVVAAGRQSRAKQSIAPGRATTVYADSTSGSARDFMDRHRSSILLLLSCKQLIVGGDTRHKDWSAEVAYPFGEEIVVRVAGMLSVEGAKQEYDQLKKRVDRLEQERQKLQRELDDPAFSEKAPEHVREARRQRLERVTREKEAAEAQYKSASVMASFDTPAPDRPGQEQAPAER
jgi:valyl-tRNA synthetase